MTVIGSPSNFWLHSARDGFDLTHPQEAASPPIYPRLPLETTTARVTIDPAKSALVIIDMQNFFLSPSLGRAQDGKGILACDQMLKHAIPACREAGVRIIWLNWGLTQHELDTMPPATLRAFGFPIAPQSSVKDNNHTHKIQPKPSFGKSPRLYKGLGSEIGPVTLATGTAVDGGRVLMRDQWNAALYPPLEDARQQGVKPLITLEDVLIHKNRISGLWGEKTLLSEYLDKEGIRTLLFGGVNTDQCVAATLQDAFAKGYDCLLLSDACGTTTPEEKGGRACVEYNCQKTWGFMLSCKDLADGVARIERS